MFLGYFMLSVFMRNGFLLFRKNGLYVYFLYKYLIIEKEILYYKLGSIYFK